MHALNDKTVLVIYSPRGEIRKEVFDFWGLRAGSPARASRVAEYDRYREALRGQGCKIATVQIQDWWRFSATYPVCFLKRWKL